MPNRPRLFTVQSWLPAYFPSGPDEAQLMMWLRSLLCYPISEDLTMEHPKIPCNYTQSPPPSTSRLQHVEGSRAAVMGTESIRFIRFSWYDTGRKRTVGRGRAIHFGERSCEPASADSHEHFRISHHIMMLLIGQGYSSRSFQSRVREQRPHQMAGILAVA